MIPISDRLRKVLEAYDYNPPRGIPLQYFNETIKKIGEEAKINEDIVIVRKQGTKKTETVEKKYNLIFSHACRRSFCTNQFYRGTLTLTLEKSVAIKVNPHS